MTAARTLTDADLAAIAEATADSGPVSRASAVEESAGAQGACSASVRRGKPHGPVARRSEYEVREVSHGSARAFIDAFHYSGGASNTSVAAHGMFRRSDGQMVGAVLWLPPTAKAAQAMAAKHLGAPSRHREVLTLSRCACSPGAPANLTGMMIAASERMVRRDPRWSLLVTYADGGEGHAGTIYSATGWAFDGDTKPEMRWRDADGRLVSRHSTKGRTVAEMALAGCRKDGRTVKRRFVKVVRSRDADL